MIKQIIMSAIIFITYCSANAQNNYSEITTQIDENSLVLQALRKQVEAQKLANKTGILPSNPEVEFNYLWGSPNIIGNRTDFSVKQSFDFPTAYAYKAKQTDIMNSNAELQYKSERLNILLNAKELCSRIVYLNAMANIYTKRNNDAQQLLLLYKKRAENGDVSIIELNKTELNYNAANAELSKILVERKAAMAELQKLNGGAELHIADSVFAMQNIPASFEQWYAEVEQLNPTLKYVKGAIEASKTDIKVQRAMSLPKLSAGYMSENVVGQQFQGVSFGVTIPLWENNNKVKKAKADLKVAETLAEDAKVAFYNSLKSLYDNAVVLQTSAAVTNKTLSLTSSESLLRKALDGGEMSLLTYLQEINYYYSAQEQLLQTQYELDSTINKLYIVQE